MTAGPAMTLAEALSRREASSGPNGECPLRATLRVLSNYSFHQMTIFLRAYSLEHGIALDTREIPYGTLMQALLSDDERDGPLLVILDSDTLGVGHSYRDAAPLEADGSRRSEKERDDVLGALANLLESHRAPVFVLLVDVSDPVFAPTPSGISGAADRRWCAIRLRLHEIVERSAAGRLLGIEKPEVDQMRLFRTGEGIISSAASAAAEMIAGAVASVLDPESHRPKKLLVTDADGTLWNGVVGEVGPQGVACDASDRGARHFLYQKMLHALSKEGVILAIASKNAQNTVKSVFHSRTMKIGLDRFSYVISTWEPKSQSVATICRTLNLLPSSTVFVDDNPSELAEVFTALPEVATLRFPEHLDELPAFFTRLRRCFSREKPATNVEKRLTSYRAVATVAQAVGGRSKEAYERYLRELNMVLTVRSVKSPAETRIVELLNKTNQFTINGDRYDDDRFTRSVAEGSILAFALRDDLADFETIGCAVLRERPERWVVEAAVLSCRVFSRHIEDAMFHAIARFIAESESPDAPVSVRVKKTSKNAPAMRFLAEARMLDAVDPLAEGVCALVPFRDPGGAFPGRIDFS